MQQIPLALAASALVPLSAAAQSAPRAAPQVTQAEQSAIEAALRSRDTARLADLFGPRIMDARAARLVPISVLGDALAECNIHRVSKDEEDPELWVQWLCPGLALDDPLPASHRAGYTARIWHSPVGLALSYATDSVYVSDGRSIPAPPSPTPRASPSRK